MPRSSETSPGSTAETEAAESRFGHNVTMQIEFTRHEVPGKLPGGTSADYLEPEGQEKARTRGKTIDKPVKAYASPAERAQETVDLAIQNVDDDVTVINQRLDASAGDKTIREKAKGQKESNVYNVRVRSELQPVKDFKVFMPQAKAWAEAQIAAGSELSVQDLAFQYYLDNPDRAREAGILTADEAAEEIAFAADRQISMTGRLKNDSDVHLINATHGPKLEPFLQHVVMQKDGSRGFKDIEDMGGSFNPGESFSFHATTDANGEPNVKLVFRGEEYNVDQEELKRMADAYREK